MTTLQRSLSATEEVVITMSILGAALQGDADFTVAIVTGEMDARMKRMIFFQEAKEHAVTEEDLQRPSVVESLERVKTILRIRIEDAIATDARQRAWDEKAKVQEGLERLTAQLRQSNKPHAMGTVDQMAKQFGVSKSEIRRRKMEGTLDELALKGLENS